MAEKDQIPPKLGHGIGEFEVAPTGEPTDIKMGPGAGMDETATSVMAKGIGEIPIGNKSSAVPGAMIDGLHNVGAIDGKEGGGKPDSLGSADSHRKNSTGMTYDYPGL